MTLRMRAVLACLCCAATAAAGQAQTTVVPGVEHAGSQGADNHGRHRHAIGTGADPAAALMDSVRHATAHLRDRNAAVRAGYRRVGIDFPAMGEHWVNPGVLLRFGLDFARPAILTYAEIDGAYSLTGVVFAMSLDSGEAAPLVAGNERPWHEHNGSLADEIRPHAHAHGGASSGRRLAVLHLWTEVPNPAGPFATDNWALPFVRLGLAVPDPLPLDAARALSLARGGERYFLELMELNGDPRVAARAEMAFAAARADVAAIIEPITQASALSRATLRDLDSAWGRLVQALSAICGECVRPL
jgi:hypothetical protein